MEKFNASIPKSETGIPFGFREIIEGVYANFLTGDIVVTGNPNQDETHNCDQMGCKQEHVLIRGKITHF